MGKYLITGVAETGKTTIARELQMRGYNVLDTDGVKELSAWIEPATGKPNPNFERHSADDSVDKYDWLWDEKHLRQLLLKSPGPKSVIFCGSSGNQDQFYNLFDKIFLLEIDDKTLTHRLLHGGREHDFGKRPCELEVVQGWYKDFQTRTKASGAIIIDATPPVHQVVDEILAKSDVKH